MFDSERILYNRFVVAVFMFFCTVKNLVPETCINNLHTFLEHVCHAFFLLLPETCRGAGTVGLNDPQKFTRGSNMVFWPPDFLERNIFW